MEARIEKVTHEREHVAMTDAVRVLLAAAHEIAPRWREGQSAADAAMTLLSNALMQNFALLAPSLNNPTRAAEQTGDAIKSTLVMVSTRGRQ